MPAVLGLPAPLVALFRASRVARPSVRHAVRPSLPTRARRSINIKIIELMPTQIAGDVLEEFGTPSTRKMARGCRLCRNDLVDSQARIGVSLIWRVERPRTVGAK